jgi:phosphonopyruvate decarboxylase
MIDPGFFCNLLASHGTEFFTGVPDSLLKSFCAWVTDQAGREKNHIIAVNEGAAVALASGYHLATGKIPLVYMQNSGIGNAVNPLLSLADGDVYRIPMILLVGWRGEPGVKDEPQHLKQGKVTCALFEAMGIPYLILSAHEDEVKGQLETCYAHIKQNNTPFALIVRKDTFAPYILGGDTGACGSETVKEESKLSREEAIEEIIRSSSPNEVFISTTGMASRELYELREKYNMGHERDFLTVGSMGHASSLALAIALQRPEVPVTCIDGDGAALMHLGSVAAIGVRSPANLRHIVLNNGAHDSVGGQPTIARKIDLSGIARSAGYARVFSVTTREELCCVLGEATGADRKNGPEFIEVIVRKGNRKDLGRPKSSPQQNKEAFMRFLTANK